VLIEDRPVATVHLVGDYRHAETIASHLRDRLIFAALLITSLLGAALWLTFRRLALAPLEDMVIERTRALSIANEELEQEIKERTTAEEALREGKEHITLLLNSVAEGIYGVDLQGRCTFCNPAALKALGFEREEEVIGRDIHELMHHTPADGLPYHPEDCHLCGCFRTGAGCHGSDEVFWRSDGESFPVEYWTQPIIRNGAPIGAVTAFIDITEKKRLEAQLLHSQKMESIGQFAGGIAHDFNNILSVILGYGEMVLADMAKDDPLRRNLEHMIEAGDRAAHLTKDLLLFSRKQALDRKSVDINKIINKLGRLLASVIGEDISFNTRLYEGELLVSADAHQFEQVIMNLAANARDSMPKGGLFTISTEPVMLDEEFTSGHGLGMPGRYVLISVSDTGHGMSTENKERIFEPFFTTKEVGKGTGLGLSVAYGIITQHEGYVNVYSEPGIGTTFRIYLPLISSCPEGEKEQPVAGTPEGGTETILLAEDDEKVRNLFLTGLRNYGYTVIEASDGEDAVLKYREHKDRIGLLIFDLIMPGKSGNEAYDEIRKIKPGIKILFVTGYSPDIVRLRASIKNPEAIIYKPFSSMDLLKKVRSILDEDGQGSA
jgi:PAS domain S-box-containing protein